MEIKIGMRATRCCEEDAFEIKTQEDIEEILENIEDKEDGLPYKIFSSFEELKENC